jgi:small subunit ribosomal protein S20
MAKDAKTGTKKKRPTAEKRMIQNKKRRVENRVFRSKIRTGIRRFEDSIKAADAIAVKEALSTAFSVLDKGVKHGVMKKNTASRTKARLTAKAAAAKA